MLTDALHLIRSRRVLAAAGLALALFVASFAGGPGTVLRAKAAPLGQTTLDKTIVPKGKKGKKKKQLKYGPGQARVTRSLIKNYPTGPGEGLAAFRQISDVHTVDEESPARVEWADKCGPGYTSAYRPQEAMSAQVGDSMMKALNSIVNGPATDVPFSFAISTGDNVDNNQYNELRWFIDLLDGEEVVPNSGGTTAEDRAASPYEGYTRDLTQNNLGDDIGVPSATALGTSILELAQDGFDATGSEVPWYAVLGNHDGLAQGNLPGTGAFAPVPLGSHKNFSPIEDKKYCAVLVEDAVQGVTDALVDLFSGHSVTADPDRRFLSNHNDVVAEYFNSTGLPEGHGFDNAPMDPQHAGTAGYYSFDIEAEYHIKGISLDTITWGGGPDGSVSNPQFQWLEDELIANSSSYYDEAGELVENPGVEDNFVVLFSHHTSKSLNNPGPDDAGAPYHCFKAGDDEDCDSVGLKDLIHRFPNVIAWVNGHEHNNRVNAYKAPEGAATRGFWEINTAAHIDWPQQSRLLEIAWQEGDLYTPDVLIIYGTMVDSAAPIKPNPETQVPVTYLAALSRYQAYKDACLRKGQADCSARGKPGSRNVKLIIPAAFNPWPDL
ncbi:MAG: TIGR03767 family metallophosphoesterase [Actinobacteria bacterium]|nr:TIGR03767 family metallophosphoesterase [Actinomycetota bacterium]